MRSIWMLGSEEQKLRWLPGIPRLDCSEPSRSPKLRTAQTPWHCRHRRHPTADGYCLDGEKRWIGTGTIADVVVVWARDISHRQVKGFLVEEAAPGYVATLNEGNGSLRACGRPTSGSP